MSLCNQFTHPAVCVLTKHEAQGNWNKAVSSCLDLLVDVISVTKDLLTQRQEENKNLPSPFSGQPSCYKTVKVHSDEDLFLLPSLLICCVIVRQD